MLLASSVSGLFKWRRFEPEVILLAVGWYLRFSLLDAIAKLRLNSKVATLPLK
jgi:transposase-like protein